jgi:hypothetical protein
MCVGLKERCYRNNTKPAAAGRLSTIKTPQTKKQPTHHIGADGEGLAQLDEGGAELLEHDPEVPCDLALLLLGRDFFGCG